MVLFFNLILLEKATNNNPQYIVIGMQKLFSKQLLPKNPFEKFKPIRNLGNGYSFLLNPSGILNSKHDVLFKAQYIRLAGRREYLMYKAKKHTYLDLALYPDLRLDQVYTNPLLTIANNKIYFKYEE